MGMCIGSLVCIWALRAGCSAMSCLTSLHIAQHSSCEALLSIQEQLQLPTLHKSTLAKNWLLLIQGAPQTCMGPSLLRIENIAA